MICELVRLGKTVGITANSHKVIRNLIDTAIKAGDELGGNSTAATKLTNQKHHSTGSHLRGRMPICSTLAVSQAAKTVVLIGDPQQLDQPTQGSHPEGTDVSALAHILGSEQTIPTDRGVFLAETWRLHPSEFTSEVFYAGKPETESRA